MADEMSVPAVEPALRLPRLGENGRGLALAPPGQGHAEAGRMSIVPGRFDEDPPRVRIARLGDTAAPRLVARGVLARDEAEVGHELPRAGKALDVCWRSSKTVEIRTLCR